MSAFTTECYQNEYLPLRQLRGQRDRHRHL
jgi:hypothetical protein